MNARCQRCLQKQPTGQTKNIQQDTYKQTPVCVALMVACRHAVTQSRSHAHEGIKLGSQPAVAFCKKRTRIPEPRRPGKKGGYRGRNRRRAGPERVRVSQNLAHVFAHPAAHPAASGRRPGDADARPSHRDRAIRAGARLVLLFVSSRGDTGSANKPACWAGLRADSTRACALGRAAGGIGEHRLALYPRKGAPSGARQKRGCVETGWLTTGSRPPTPRVFARHGARPLLT